MYSQIDVYIVHIYYLFVALCEIYWQNDCTITKKESEKERQGEREEECFLLRIKHRRYQTTRTNMVEYLCQSRNSSIANRHIIIFAIKTSPLVSISPCNEDKVSAVRRAGSVFLRQSRSYTSLLDKVNRHRIRINI